MKSKYNYDATKSSDDVTDDDSPIMTEEKESRNHITEKFVNVKKESLQFLGIENGVPLYRKITQSDTLTKGSLRNTGISVLYRAIDTENGIETVILYNHDKKVVTKCETSTIEQIFSLEYAVSAMLDMIPIK